MNKKEFDSELAQKVADESAKQINEDRSLAMDLIQALNQQNKEHEASNKEHEESNKKTVRLLIKVIIALVVIFGSVISGIVGGFIWLWNQYDYESSSTVTATGIYTAVDSNNNIIAQDITGEQWELFIEWLTINGNNNSN